MRQRMVITLKIKIFHLTALLMVTLRKALSGVTKIFSRTRKPKR